MKTTIQDKAGLVNSVFSKVYKKYDLMNDIMSFGIHRVWENKLIEWMNPQQGENLVDVASGTGDIARLFSKRNNHLNQISCVEPNNEMFKNAKYVFHFAGIGDIVPSIENPINYMMTNVQGTVKVLEAARYSKVKKFVYAA